jgi:hypothetical protein
MPAKYLVIDSSMYVTDPEGEMTERPALLFVCPAMTPGGTVGVKLIGQGPLKGYMIDVRLDEVNRCISSGLATDQVPDGLISGRG